METEKFRKPVEKECMLDAEQQVVHPAMDVSDDPELDFTALSAEASRNAVERAFSAGLSVTYMSGDQLFEKFPDGHVRTIPEEEVKAMLEGHPWP